MKNKIRRQSQSTYMVQELTRQITALLQQISPQAIDRQSLLRKLQKNPQFTGMSNYLINVTLDEIKKKCGQVAITLQHNREYWYFFGATPTIWKKTMPVHVLENLEAIVFRAIILSSNKELKSGLSNKDIEDFAIRQGHHHNFNEKIHKICQVLYGSGLILEHNGCWQPVKNAAKIPKTENDWQVLICLVLDLVQEEPKIIYDPVELYACYLGYDISSFGYHFRTSMIYNAFATCKKQNLNVRGRIEAFIKESIRIFKRRQGRIHSGPRFCEQDGCFAIIPFSESGSHCEKHRGLLGKSVDII